MTHSDPWAALAAARSGFALAVERKEAARPGSPEYRVAVHELGVAWGRVQVWERRVRERVRPSDASDPDGRPVQRPGR